ncbi:hypothetical protein EDB84DRAFT_1443385 [Lactarius hengduanensis]|nr:hypothetical protein EDB84DRAFT_1443385 [Lactarius hengduanensis]
MACQLVNLLTLANFWGLYQLVPAGASWGQLVPVRKVTRQNTDEPKVPASPDSERQHDSSWVMRFSGGDDARGSLPTLRGSTYDCTSSRSRLEKSQLGMCGVGLRNSLLVAYQNVLSAGFRVVSDVELDEKINEIIKANSKLAQTGSTGLNRRNRWTTEKAAAGSFPAGSDSTASGNVANAQAAAQRSANNIVKQRGSAFASLKNANSLESAKIGLLVSLTNRCLGLAVVDDDLMLVEVLTMYKKSGAKITKHSWMSSTTSIGALSYLVIR